jgi:cyclopropane-fatty-acyl-phospholipid synthase
MGLFSFEHGPAAYRADFIAYGLGVTALAGWSATTAWRGAPADAVVALAWVLAGGVLWTALEYALHRGVLHGVEPFRHWHAEHHLRPQARIGSPTLLTAAGFAALVWLPAWALLGPAPAAALTLGVVAGYWAYGLTHHALHHGPTGPAWLQRRRRWHAVHHAAHRALADGRDSAVCFGVTTPFWDRVWGSALAPPHGRDRP